MTFTKKRYDIVGSFLRPQALIEAREAHRQGNLDDQGLRQIENELIKDLVAKQLDAGLTQVTDGEFRRSWWHLDFFWGLEGIAPATSGQTAENFHMDELEWKYSADSLQLTGPISADNHPFIQDFIALNDILAGFNQDQAIAKITLPSPARLYYDLSHSQADLDQIQAIYGTKADFFQAIVTAYRQVVADLYQAGARSIQFDDPIWITLVDQARFENIYSFYQGDLNQLKDQLAQDFVSLNNQVLADQPEDLIFSTHNCRGNFKSQWASQGAYDEIAAYAFGQQTFDRQFLEYDTDRAGDFQALHEIRPGTDVVLGLITSKDGKLEDKAAILKRLIEASQHIAKDQLYLSPQCGFASTEAGNILTEDDQWAKLKLIRDIANEFWTDAEAVNQ